MKESSLNRLFRFVLAHWPFLLLSTLAAFFFVIFNSASIWITATMINNILIDFNEMLVENQRLSSLSELTMNDRLKLFSNSLLLKDTAISTVSAVCVALIIVFSAKNISLYIKNITLSIVQYRLIRDLRNKLYSHFHYLSLSYFNKNKSGELTAVLVNDIDNMRNSLSIMFQKLFVEPINIIILMSLLFIVSTKLALIALLIIPVSGIIIFGISHSIRRRSARSQAQLAGMTSMIAETIGSMRIVKAFATKGFEINRFAKETQKYYKLMLRRDRLRFVSSPVSETFGATIAALLLWVGARDVLVIESISSEDFLRFILLLFSLFQPLKNLTNVVNELQNGLASADRVFAIMDINSDIQDIDNAVEVNDLKNTLSFDNVSFSYGDEKDKVLNDINFQINKGEILALVGPSGAGKSTLVDLIPRFYDTLSGSIKIDGKDIKELKINSLRSLMGIVTQETFLFDDSVKANIAYGVENISDDKIKDAAIAANAHEFIKKLPNGYNTIIGERGVSLSGGQKQRIAIARAILTKPKVLILDEATSALDYKSEYYIINKLVKEYKDSTILFVTHRTSSLVLAKKIIHIDKGIVIEQGSYNELMENKRQFYSLTKINDVKS